MARRRIRAFPQAIPLGMVKDMVLAAVVKVTRKDMVMRFLSIGSLLVASAWLAGCSSSNATPAKASAPTAKPMVSASASEAPSQPQDDFVASGPLVVENQVEVESQREGMMSRVAVDTGAMVQKGELLGELDNRQALADRDAAAARVRSLEYDVKGWEYETKVLQADLERAEKMWEAQLITKQDLDHTRFKVESDKYETERYRANLESA